MQQKKSATDFMGEATASFQKMMENSPLATAFDMGSIMDMQRKNMQALAEANKRVMQGWQNLSQKQGEMMSQMMQNNAVSMNPADTAAAMKTACEKVMANATEIGEIMRQCGTDTAEVLNKRMAATMNEMKMAAGDKE